MELEEASKNHVSCLACALAGSLICLFSALAHFCWSWNLVFSCCPVWCGWFFLQKSLISVKDPKYLGPLKLLLYYKIWTRWIYCLRRMPKGTKGMVIVLILRSDCTFGNQFDLSLHYLPMPVCLNTYLLLYRNDPKFLDRYAWANSVDPDQSDQVLHICIFWTHYSVIKRYCCNFRIITAVSLGVKMFRIL